MRGAAATKQNLNFLFVKQKDQDGEKSAHLSTGRMNHVARLINDEMQPATVDGVLRYEFNGSKCRGEVLSVRAYSPKAFTGAIRVIYDDGSSEIRIYRATVVRELKNLEIGETTDHILV
jgi:hypothetical protein